MDSFDELLSRLHPETDLEWAIVADPAWREGAAWGAPRTGHPEGMVLAHILDVLANVDAQAIGDEDRRRLRLVALVHDTFKHSVDFDRPRTGDNHHAAIARRFAERYIDDPALLEVIELHDEAHNAWSMGARDPRRWPKAQARAKRLIARLGDDMGFYLRFYRADNATAGKSAGGLPWFAQLAEGSHSRRSLASAAQRMPAYSFLTTWCVAAPIQDVWDVISASDRYPEWWKGVRAVTELEPGGEHGLGALSRFAWRSKLPYTLQFDVRVTRSQPPHLLEAHASGELEGVGIWRLYESPAGTALVYSWDVSTTRAWMNRLAPIGRPVFAWNHDYVMRQGARGLADRLGVELVARS